MTSTSVDICNLALGRARATKIGALDEGSPTANTCNEIYEPTRDHLLTLYSWRFAKTTRALSQKSESPTEWLYSYDYPNDCLRVHYIVPREQIRANDANVIVPTPYFDYGPDPYEVATGDDGSRRIWTDREEAHISYTKAVDDVRLFDPLFVQALAWLLVVDIAIEHGGDAGQRYVDRAEKKFKEVIAQAVAHSENESEDGRQRLPRSIQVRGGSNSVRDVINGDPIYRRY